MDAVVQNRTEGGTVCVCVSLHGCSRGDERKGMIDSSCIIHEFGFIMVVLGCVVGSRGKGSKESQVRKKTKTNVSLSVTMGYPSCR